MWSLSIVGPAANQPSSSAEDYQEMRLQNEAETLVDGEPSISLPRAAFLYTWTVLCGNGCLVQLASWYVLQPYSKGP